MTASLDAFVDLAQRLADAARPIARQHFRTPLAVDDKPDASPVTIADRAIEAAQRQLIEQVFPDHGILGEEHGAEHLDAEYVWVLDPIDGTKSFITGKPLFGSLIALVRHGRPIVGVIDMPALNERWLGVEGRPTLAQGKPARCRPCKALGSAILYATSPHMFTAGPEFAAFERLRAQVKHPLYGADCYAYGLLASGYVDLVVEASLKPYDFCALAPVIEGAGGSITDWLGEPLTIHSDGRVIAAGDSALHRLARTALGV